MTMRLAFVLCDVSEHGLGHLLNPVDPDADQAWIHVLWEGIVTEDVLERPYPWPEWLSRPAVSRVTVSAPQLLHLFDHLNNGRHYAEQIKPYNFILTTHVASLGHPPGTDPERFHLYAPYTRDAQQWLRMEWVDGYSGRIFHITTTGPIGREGLARVKTYADVLAEYRVHREPKSLGPDGSRCTHSTRGVMQRRWVIATDIASVGKESNKLEDVEAGLVHDVAEVFTEYTDPRRGTFKTLALPVLRDLPPREIASEVGLDLKSVKQIRAGRTEPHRPHKAALFALAVKRARDSLRKWHVACPHDDLGACVVYLEERKHRGARACRVCQKAVAHPRASYCSAACKHRAYRRRKSLR
jgi:hypothetical protein